LLTALKATPSELSTILVGLTRVGSEFKPNEGQVFTSALLNSILKILPTIREPARDFLSAINIKAAKENNEADLWTDPDKYPDVQDAKDVRPLRQTCRSWLTVAVHQYLRERAGSTAQRDPQDRQTAQYELCRGRRDRGVSGLVLVENIH
jgi:hypothetical protein